MRNLVLAKCGQACLATVLMFVIPVPVWAQSATDTNDAMALLERIDDQAKSLTSKRPLAIAFRYEFGSSKGDSTDPIQLEYQKEVEVEFFPNGAISERLWALDEEGQRKTKLPDLEVQYDGKGVASVRAAKARPRVSYHPDPSPSDAIGIRADNILAPLGKSSWYSMLSLIHI